MKVDSKYPPLIIMEDLVDNQADIALKDNIPARFLAGKTENMDRNNKAMGLYMQLLNIINK